MLARADLHTVDVLGTQRLVIEVPRPCLGTGCPSSEPFSSSPIAEKVGIVVAEASGPVVAGSLPVEANRRSSAHSAWAIPRSRGCHLLAAALGVIPTMLGMLAPI